MKNVMKADSEGIITVTDDNEVLKKAISNLISNNTYVPDISKIQINESKEQMTVWFDDDSWVTVKRSTEDDADDMIGLIYAIMKRICGTPTASGYVQGNGFMGKLKKCLDNAMTEKKAEELKQKRIREANEKTKREHEEAMERKRSHPSLGLRFRNLEDKFDKLLDTLGNLEDKFDKLLDTLGGSQNKKKGFFSR